MSLRRYLGRSGAPRTSDSLVFIHIKFHFTFTVIRPLSYVSNGSQSHYSFNGSAVVNVHNLEITFKEVSRL